MGRGRGNDIENATTTIESPSFLSSPDDMVDEDGLSALRRNFPDFQSFTEFGILQQLHYVRQSYHSYDALSAFADRLEHHP